MRCQLCSLSGEDLRKDEDLRKELQSKDEKWRSFCDSGMFDRAIEILREKLQLIEANKDKFNNQVRFDQQSFLILMNNLFRCI